MLPSTPTLPSPSNQRDDVDSVLYAGAHRRDSFSENIPRSVASVIRTLDKASAHGAGDAAESVLSMRVDADNDLIGSPSYRRHAVDDIPDNNLSFKSAFKTDSPNDGNDAFRPYFLPNVECDQRRRRARGRWIGDNFRWCCCHLELCGYLLKDFCNNNRRGGIACLVLLALVGIATAATTARWLIECRSSRGIDGGAKCIQDELWNGRDDGIVINTPGGSNVSTVSSMIANVKDSQRLKEFRMSYCFQYKLASMILLDVDRIMKPYNDLLCDPRVMSHFHRFNSKLDCRNVGNNPFCNDEVNFDMCLRSWLVTIDRSANTASLAVRTCKRLNLRDSCDCYRSILAVLEEKIQLLCYIH